MTTILFVELLASERLLSTLTFSALFDMCLVINEKKNNSVILISFTSLVKLDWICSTSQWNKNKTDQFEKFYGIWEFHICDILTT